MHDEHLGWRNRMSEPKPLYDYGQYAERQVQHEAVKRLRKAGWEVVVTSQPSKTRKQLRSVPDVLAWRHDTSLLIECKSATGELNEAQADFLERINPHTGTHLVYMVVRYPADVDAYCQPPRPPGDLYRCRICEYEVRTPVAGRHDCPKCPAADRVMLEHIVEDKR